MGEKTGVSRETWGAPFFEGVKERGGGEETAKEARSGQMADSGEGVLVLKCDVSRETMTV